MKRPSSAIYFFGLAAVIIVGLIGYKIYQSRAPSPYDSFAQCLTEKGVKMWGAWWCPNCENQKIKFGNSFRYVKYIECSPGKSRDMSRECREAGITAYPTWEFGDGSRQTGDLHLPLIAEHSGCEL